MAEENEEMIRKTLETSAFFAGGELNPEQQREFLELVRNGSKLLQEVRVEHVTNPKQDIDRLHIGEPVTRKATENDAVGYEGQAKFSKVEISTVKTQSSWDVTTEALQRNIAQNRLEQALMQSMTKRIGTDFELLGLNGDTTITGTTPMDELLKTLDGWDLQTASAHIVDAAGANVSKGLFAAMIRRLPKQYRGDPGLRWILSDTIANDWIDTISDRLTVAGDQALAGQKINPMGIPMLTVPLLPDDLALTVTEATSAWVRGDRQGPFEILAGANTLKLNIDAAGSVTVALTVNRVMTAGEVAAEINATSGLEGIASDDGEGRVILASTTTGTSSTVEIEAVASDVYTILGLTVGTTTGTGSGSDDTIYEGSFILLTNPKNLVWAVLDKTRVYSEFNKDKDRVEVVVYNEVDAKIENVDAVVKSTNVRIRDLV